MWYFPFFLSIESKKSTKCWSDAICQPLQHMCNQYVLEICSHYMALSSPPLAFRHPPVREPVLASGPGPNRAKGATPALNSVPISNGDLDTTEASAVRADESLVQGGFVTMTWLRSRDKVGGLLPLLIRGRNPRMRRKFGSGSRLSEIIFNFVLNYFLPG